MVFTESSDEAEDNMSFGQVVRRNPPGTKSVVRIRIFQIEKASIYLMVVKGKAGKLIELFFKSIWTNLSI